MTSLEEGSRGCARDRSCSSQCSLGSLSGPLFAVPCRTRTAGGHQLRKLPRPGRPHPYQSGVAAPFGRLVCVGLQEVGQPVQCLCILLVRSLPFRCLLPGPLTAPSRNDSGRRRSCILPMSHAGSSLRACPRPRLSALLPVHRVVIDPLDVDLLAGAVEVVMHGLAAFLEPPVVVDDGIAPG